MLAIRVPRAFDGERMLDGGVVVLTDEGRVVAVDAAPGAVPADCPVADYPDATALPGLIDAHVHLCGDSQVGALDRLGEYAAAALDEVIAAGLRAQLAAGVTAVRDLGDRRFAVLEWRRTAEAAGVAGSFPTIVAAGPPLTSGGGHCWNMGGEVAGAAALRAAVRDRAERGTDLVKIMASGGIMTPGTDVMRCQFEEAELRVVVEEAHARGLAVTAHAHGLPAVEQAVRAGVDGIEHFSCLTPTGITMSDHLLESLVRQRIAVCPTLGRVAGVAPSPALLALMEQTGLTWEARMRQAGQMHRAGVLLVSGSDAGIGPGKPHGLLQRSVAGLVGGGVPVADALASATSTAAEVCGLGDRKGRLRPGYDADMLLVNGDPRTDIAALDRVTAVLLGGTMVAGPA